MRFKDKRVVITGGAKGIGRGVGLRFGREGASVAVCDMDFAAAKRTASEIEGLGTQAIAVQANVRSSKEVAEMTSEVVRQFGGIDILVNNAGITIAKPVLEFPEDEWEMTLDINLKGVIRCCKEVGEVMVRQQRGGRIINISSESGKTAKPNFTVYAASKFAVVGFTQGLALELAAHGITVNAVCPGIVLTEMWENLAKQLGKRQNVAPEEVLEQRRKQIPLGRLQTPEDVAGVVAFLASEDAGYMTGQAVNVTGGREFH